MLSNLEAKATIQAANRIKALITAEQPFRVQTQRRDDNSWREQRRRERHRREQELFGKHPLWRRITGITFVYESRMRARERKKGIKRLLKWLEKQLKRAEGAGLASLSATTPWDFAFNGWQRVRASGRSIESLCQELEMSRARLTTLTKELCGLSAQEIVDGFKIRKLRGALVEQLRAAARELWGAPGSYVWTKVDVPMKLLDPECEDEGPEASCSLRSPSPAGRATRLGESRAEEITRRTEELFQAMCHGQPLFGCPCDRRTGAPARLHGQPTTAARGTFDLEVLALQLGFASASRLKRACLNVLGRTLKQVQRMLAHEVVRYYLCAEDKALRDLALCDDNTRLTRRARLLYWGSDERPDEPFLDEWSKHEQLAKEWLHAMWREYG